MAFRIATDVAVRDLLEQAGRDGAVRVIRENI
jgi:hypothetical protein